MPTKLNQDQISGLPSDLESLESFISTEDSAGDSADVSQNATLTAQQSEITLLKEVCRGLLFPKYVFIYQDGSTIYSGDSTQGYPIPVTITYSWEFADDPEAMNWAPIEEADQPSYTPASTSSYLYRLKITYTSDLGVTTAFSQGLTYSPLSGGSPA